MKNFSKTTFLKFNIMPVIFVTLFVIVLLITAGYLTLETTKLGLVESITIFALILSSYTLYLTSKNISRQITIEKDRKICNETLTHDLKTPILAQIKMLEFLYNEKAGPLNKTQKELLKHTLSSGHFAQEMLKSMISSLKFTNNEYILSIEEFDIKELVENCVSQLDLTAFNKNLEFKLNTDRLTDKTMYADAISIKRAILNIIFNAISFSAENGNINIDISTENNNLRLITKVKTLKTQDTKDDFKEFFSKYTVEKNPYKQVGTGIGLYLAKVIIKNYNGKILYDIMKDDKDYDFYKFGFEMPLNNEKLNNKVFKINYL